MHKEFNIRSYLWGYLCEGNLQMSSSIPLLHPYNIKQLLFQVVAFKGHNTFLMGVGDK